MKAFPRLKAAQEFELDYTGASDAGTLTSNLSGVTASGDDLWTVSDEGRTVEHLRRDEKVFRLHDRIDIDTRIPDLPGRKKARECDLEGLDIAHGRLWIAGSHSKVRPKVDKCEPIAKKVRKDRGRRLLASVPLDGGKGRALPVRGKGSLRRRLADDPILAPFLKLASKENGFDIEGLAVLGDRLLLGLRGPVVDNTGVVMELALDGAHKIRGRHPRRHFLATGGLGVRDLVVWDDAVIVLAGPMTAMPGPYVLYRWHPQRTNSAQGLEGLGTLPTNVGSPEGLTRFDRDGKPGLLVVFDRPPGKPSGPIGAAQWFAFD